MSSFFTKPGRIDPITSKILDKDPGPLGKMTLNALPNDLKKKRPRHTQTASKTLLSTSEEDDG
tara:strand:+ start:2516 stop:2704 length:189 start_codon:yes stop_codon:yes gene_type:complete